MLTACGLSKFRWSKFPAVLDSSWLVSLGSDCFPAAMLNEPKQLIWEIQVRLLQRHWEEWCIYASLLPTPVLLGDTEIWDCRVQCSTHSWSYLSVISRVVNIRKTPKQRPLLASNGARFMFYTISFNARGQLYKFIIRKYIKMMECALRRQENPTHNTRYT